MPALRSLPLVRSLGGYQRRAAGNDAAAAAVLTALLIPAGMGYAQAAGLPAITGLYATVTSLVVYALVGPSRVLVYGPDSSLAALIAAAVLPLAAGDPERAVMLAGLLAVLTGLMCLAAGLTRFGFLADLLSAPVRVGYMNGIAISVLIRQLAPLFGVDGGGTRPLVMLSNTVRQVADGAANMWALGVGLGCLVVIAIAKRVGPKIPGTLLALALPALAALFIDLPGRGIDVIGRLPRGLPLVDWTLIDRGDVANLAVAAAGISFVAFADTSVLSRSISARRNEPVDPNHELLALGAVNLACGVTGGFAVSASSSRTPVAEAAGARTQLTGLFAAALVALAIAVAPGVLREVPTSALAAVVIAAAMSLIDTASPRRWFATRRSEFLLSIAAFAAIVILGVIPGIALAIGASLLAFMRRAWRPHATTLVRVDGLKGYHEAERHPEGRSIPGLVLYRFDAPLFFANAGYFVEDVLAKIAPDTRQITITAEPITDIDASAAEALEALIDQLDQAKVALTFAELKGHVKDQFVAYGLLDRIGGEAGLARTVGEAVKRYVRANGVDWTDWEDAEPGSEVSASWADQSVGPPDEATRQRRGPGESPSSNP